MLITCDQLVSSFRLTLNSLGRCFGLLRGLVEGFRLHVRSSRTYYLQSSADDQMRDWSLKVYLGMAGMLVSSEREEVRT